jgi:hypothetical protein
MEFAAICAVWFVIGIALALIAGEIGEWLWNRGRNK